MTTMKQFPLYQSHKKVWALKIAAIRPEDVGVFGSQNSSLIVPAEEGYLPFAVSAAYMAKHKPEVGGYFVQYADGYKSFSPAKAFEGGYTRVGANALELGAMVRAAGLAGE